MKKIVLAIVLFLIVGGIWYYLDRVNQPSELSISDTQRKKALSKLLNREAVLNTKKSSNKWIEYRDNNIGFSYPEIADIHADDKKPPLLESFQYGIREPHVNMSIQVVDGKGSNDISEYPAVTLRQNQKDIYKSDPKTLDGKTGIEFIKIADGVEKSSFFIYKGKIYSVVATGFDLKDTDKLYQRTLTSLIFP